MTIQLGLASHRGVGLSGRAAQVGAAFYAGIASDALD